LISFCVVSLCQSLKSFGNLSTCQKINDENWKGPDMKNIGKGLFADGLSVALGGFLGGMATDTSASNVGLSAATAATSRRIAYYAGFIFAILGFLPKMAVIFSVMPKPIMGAIHIFFYALWSFQASRSWSAATWIPERYSSSEYRLFSA
jgi:NCS2 family nucleobase:cation symporter-2